MFGWGVLKRGVPKSVRFCIGDLSSYTFLDNDPSLNGKSVHDFSFFSLIPTLYRGLASDGISFSSDDQV